MRFANPHPPRRGAFLLIALFSCLQIIFGFFLFTGNEQEYDLPVYSSMQLAYIDPAIIVSNIEPASGIMGTTRHTQTSHNRNTAIQTSTGQLSYFKHYREKAAKREALTNHNTLNENLQQKHRQHRPSQFPPALSIQDGNSINSTNYNDYP